jgi:hypothetical protein
MNLALRNVSNKPIFNFSWTEFSIGGFYDPWNLLDSKRLDIGFWIKGQRLLPGTIIGSEAPAKISEI